MKISQNSQKTICVRISFFDKVKLCRSAASLKTRILVNFPKFVRTTPDDCLWLRQYQLLTISAKQAPSQMFDWVENRLQSKSLKYWAHFLFPVFKLSRENTQSKNMCEIIFEKGKLFMQKHQSKAFFKKGVICRTPPGDYF